MNIIDILKKKIEIKDQTIAPRKGCIYVVYGQKVKCVEADNVNPCKECFLKTKRCVNIVCSKTKREDCNNIKLIEIK